MDPSIRVEIKFVASEKDEEVVRAALDLFDKDPEHRDVYFFDTGDLALFDRGMVLRARQIRDGKDDSTVKLRPFSEGEARRWEDVQGFEVEMDVVGGQAVLSAKLSEEQEHGEISDVRDGKRPIRRLFSNEQEKLIKAFRPEGISWGDLRLFGPAKVHKWEIEPRGFLHVVAVEEWLLPNSDDLVELSIKVNAGALLEASEEFKAFLSGQQIYIATDQQAKTRSTLELFAPPHHSSRQGPT